MHSKYTWISVVLLALGFGALGFGVGRLAAASGSFDGYAWGENVGWIHFR